ncbi:MAG: hypothetical protein KC503_34335, partial [Myxococcales bacterium]|nr:hypothetical protein [Myxococcales bacterium]
MRVTFTLSLLAVLLAAPSAHAQDASADGALPDLGAGAPCGAITIKGCCDGDILRYCAAGSTKAQRCAPGSCGWDPQSSFYGCGTSGGADPTGVNTRTCPAPQSADAATDGARGDGPRD